MQNLEKDQANHTQNTKRIILGTIVIFLSCKLVGLLFFSESTVGGTTVIDQWVVLKIVTVPVLLGLMVAEIMRRTIGVPDTSERNISCLSAVLLFIVSETATCGCLPAAVFSGIFFFLCANLVSFGIYLNSQILRF